MKTNDPRAAPATPVPPPAPDDHKKLKDAAMLLRMVVATKGPLLCLRDKIADWLTRNDLNGSILRRRGDS